MFAPRSRPVFKILFLFSCFVSLSFLVSCGDGEKKPDVSGIKVSISSKRFDRELQKLDTNALDVQLQNLKNQYPAFLDLYLDHVMGFRIGGVYSGDNPGVELGLKNFLSSKDIRGLFDTVNKHYPDTKAVEDELARGFQYMIHYYPKYKVPDITYFISGLNNWGVFLYGENQLAIGLDMFLGAGYPFYRSVGLQDYLQLQLRKEYIPVAVFRNIYQDMHPDTIEDRTLLDIMIQRGKEQYFLSKMLPFKSEGERFAYWDDQVEDSEKNEGFIYNFFVQKELLYSTSMERIYPFVNDGPVTKEISDECPGNIGSWIGYRIVQAYMKEHPKTTLEQLLNMTDAQRILLESKYKPK